MTRSYLDGCACREAELMTLTSTGRTSWSEWPDNTMDEVIHTMAERARKHKAGGQRSTVVQVLVIEEVEIKTTVEVSRKDSSS